MSHDPSLDCNLNGKCSLDRNLNGKCSLDQAPASAADFRYEAKLRDKLQCEKVAMDLDRWGSPPPWFVEETRHKEVAAAAVAAAPVAPSSAWEDGWAGQAGPSSVPAPPTDDHPPGFPTVFGRGLPPPPALLAPILFGPP